VRFPSITDAAAGAGATFRRFPMALVSALAACFVAILMIDGPGDDWMPRFLATATMGIALFTAAGTTAERFRLSPGRRWLVNAVLAAGLLAIYAVSLEWTDRLAPLRFGQLMVLAHLCVAVGPYVATDRTNGFWHYNRFLLLRFLTAAFFAAVLFAGLSLALLALDTLFGVNVRGEAYGYLFVVLAFVFHPLFFLAGVPDDFAELDAREDYPGVLKVFSQFVLIPLVTVYLVILTSYLGKVLVTRTWPSGWIGYLVSSVSMTGVLALLLVHPIRRRADSPWIGTFSRWWFVVLLPSLVMLMLAVLKRTGQYGVTEQRYFLLALTLWMLGISLYYGLTGSANIKRIPETLLLVVLLTAIGPWSAYAVSVRSQTARLETILARLAMGRPGKIVPPGGPVLPADRIQIGAILRYLGDTHGPGALARALGVPADTALDWAGRTDMDDPLTRMAMRRIGVEYADRWAGPGVDETVYASLETQRSVEIAGFEVMRNAGFPGLGWIGTAADSLEMVTDTATATVTVRHGGEALMTLDVLAAVRENLTDDVIAVRRNLRLSRPVMVEGSAGGYRVRLVLETVYGQRSGDNLKVQGGSGFVLAAGFKDRR
jgi:hypothetical protein